MLRWGVLSIIGWLVFAAIAHAEDSVNKAKVEMNFAVVRLSSSFNCEPNCPEWIAAEGPILEGTAAKFAKFLKTIKNKNIPVILHSGGGSINDALAMGRLIRKNGMNTAIGWTSFSGCSPFRKSDVPCEVDPITGAFAGKLNPFQSACHSACPLLLLGGQQRVVDPASRIGLHQPLAQGRPFVDRFWETYRMVNGKKKVLSRKFLKREYLPVKQVAGISPLLRKKLLAYVKEMGASPDILSEMEKASPANLNFVPYGDHSRERLGFSSDSANQLDIFGSAAHCQGLQTSTGNCIFFQQKRPQVLRPFDRGTV